LRFEEMRVGEALCSVLSIQQDKKNTHVESIRGKKKRKKSKSNTLSLLNPRPLSSFHIKNEVEGKGR